MPKIYLPTLEGRTQAARDAMEEKYGRRDETHLRPYYISPKEQARIDDITDYANHAVNHAANEKIVK